jgi:hypothetical protein
MGINLRPQVPQETQEYPMIMSLGLPAALMNSSIGPVDNTQYDPINKWRVIATSAVINRREPARLDRNGLCRTNFSPGILLAVCVHIVLTYASLSLTSHLLKKRGE